MRGVSLWLKIGAGLSLVAACLVPACGDREASKVRLPVDPADAALADKYLQIVREHCDTILKHGRDKYGTTHTPLFVDGLEVDTFEPVQWNYDGRVWTLSNLANHQSLFRTLSAVSNLTGDESYRDAAKAAIAYGFDHLVRDNGLLLWGGHTCWCAESDEWVGQLKYLVPQPPPLHELKTQYPFYELMWEVDEEKTKQFIRSMWAGHVYDWSKLDFDRHNKIGFALPSSKIWHEQKFDPESPVGFRSRGRTFFGFGSDLIYAAVQVSRLDDNDEALSWATRLARRFTRDARNPETGLIPYQYSHREEIDRAQAQYEGAFSDHRVTEANLFDPVSLTQPLLSLMRISETLPEPHATEFRTMATDALVAIGRHAYDPETEEIRAMTTDGTDLTTVPFPRDGYFGRKGTSLSGRLVTTFFLDFCLAARISGDPFLWDMARRCASRADLGDIGGLDGSEIDLNLSTGMPRPEFLVGFLELYEYTQRRPYLDMAIRIADNILKDRYVNGLFTSGPDFRFTRTSQNEALALMHLVGQLTHREDLVPTYFDSLAYFACRQKPTDANYVFDYKIIYSQKRGTEPE